MSPPYEHRDVVGFEETYLVGNAYHANHARRRGAAARRSSATTPPASSAFWRTACRR